MAERSRPPPAPRAAPRIVIITGGSSGIGRAAAGLFARRGWSVGLIARGAAGLQAALADVQATGATGAVAVADVADAEALDQAARALTAQLGPADAWINAAGNGVYGRLLDVTDAEFRRVTDVTYMGTVNGVRAALRIMLPRDAGAIVNVCSGIVFHGLPLMSSYVGAKAAVRGFGQSIQVELKMAGSRVRLATIFPPAVNTPVLQPRALAHGLPGPAGATGVPAGDRRRGALCRSHRALPGDDGDVGGHRLLLCRAAVAGAGGLADGAAALRCPAVA